MTQHVFLCGYSNGWFVQISCENYLCRESLFGSSRNMQRFVNIRVELHKSTEDSCVCAKKKICAWNYNFICINWSGWRVCQKTSDGNGLLLRVRAENRLIKTKYPLQHRGTQALKHTFKTIRLGNCDINSSSSAS